MPKVSVILTSFNHENYIRQAIDSVLNQSFTDFELIIWDDASVDGSWAVINSYSDPRIKSFRNEVSKRGIFGINKAISEVATSEYIAIHHSDDIWELDKLEKQVAFLDANQEIGAVFTWAQIINEHGVKSTENWFNQENKTTWQWLNQLFLEQNYLNHPSVLIRKQCYQDVGIYRYGLAQTGDAEMWSRVLIKFPIHVIQEKLTKHRLFSDNSNTSGPRIEVAIRASNEWNVLRENYLSITSFEDIVEIFPSLERFRTPKGFDNKFLLAMACLYECKQQSAWQLGLKWMFELINDKARYKLIGELYSFSYMDFIKLTSQFDVYYIDFAKSLDSRDREIDALHNEIDALLNEIDVLHNTISWKVTAPLRSVKKFYLQKRKLSLLTPCSSTPGTESYRVRILAVPHVARPRMVHVIGNFMTGGSSRLVVDLFEHLGHLYEQEVVTQFNPQPPNYTGIPIQEFKRHQSKSFIAYLRRFQPELVHIHYWGSLDKRWYTKMINACSEFGCKVVENINTPVSPYVDDCISRYVYVSDYVKNTFGTWKAPGMTIYPGSNFQLFDRDTQQAVQDDCIGMVYRLDTDKLKMNSIDVFIKVVQKRPKTKVIIVGGGQLFDAFKAVVKANKVEGAFNFTGFVPYEKLPALYEKMSIFVAPVWRESFGQVTPFAMSMGIPVVGYNVGALAEILGDDTLLAPPDDSDVLAKIIIRLLDDRQRRELIGQRNRVRAHRLFSVENMIESYAQLYRELIGNKI